MGQKFPRPPVKGPVVIPNCAEVKIKWTQGGLTLTNVLHGSLTAAGPLNPAIAESIFSAVKANAATTTWLGHVHPSCSLSGVEVKDLRAANNPGLVSTGLAAPGTSAGGEQSQAVAFVITLKTAFSGKGYFGRAYLPGVASDNLADSRHFVNTLGTPAVAFMNGINAAMTAQGIPWVLGRRALQANTDPAAPPHQQQSRPADTIPIQAAEANDYRIDSQRKRLGRK
jgi:hypothetical protein